MQIFAQPIENVYVVCYCVDVHIRWAHFNTVKRNFQEREKKVKVEWPPLGCLDCYSCSRFTFFSVTFMPARARKYFQLSRSSSSSIIHEPLSNQKISAFDRHWNWKWWNKTIRWKSTEISQQFAFHSRSQVWTALPLASNIYVFPKHLTECTLFSQSNIIFAWIEFRSSETVKVFTTIQRWKLWMRAKNDNFIWNGEARRK